MTPNDAADAIPDVARDETGEKLAAVRTLGAGSPVLAFDVGGTDIKSALFDADGRALGLRRTPTPAADGDRTPALLDRLQVLAAQLRDEHPDVTPRAAGLVVPGIVDAAAGIGVFASNMGWRDAPLRALAAERLGLPVAFDHDVRAASWAEHELGGARAYDDAVILVIGTGIAGALLVGGHPYTAGGYAGEIGHSPIADGPVCPCGARGCLEAVASAGAIARRYREATGTTPDGAKDVIARAAAGDRVAADIWDSALDALTLSLAQLTAVVAPEAVVIGGGLSRAGGALFDELRTRLAARLSFHRLPALVPAELSGNAGLIGAALRARELA
ncbi:ROK family protein [Microbacterium paraoxydans]|uniref:ROK family protein n=2 Tax=Microbacterium TaxID=33882 RepID=UPI0022864131|nr:ROK family protein [Microbacterium paraoxydans]MCZ0711027.1 ROK family protein [Microbacterium paraoxydans]